MDWLKPILDKGQAFLVGGCVRDELLGIESNDRDILVTGIPASELESILRAQGSVKLVGQHFGIFIFRPVGSDETFEIALPRTENSTGSGHTDFEVQVDHTLPLVEDLRRRDFTINAIAKDLATGLIIDPWGGQVDIKCKIIRQVFDDTFKEDPLRILRACQFAGRLGFTLEERTFQCMRENAHLVPTLSQERIFIELNKLLMKSPKPSIGFNLMRDTNCLEHILPELVLQIGVDQPAIHHAHQVFEHTMAVIDACAGSSLEVMWAAVAHDFGKPSCMGTHPDDGRITFHGHDEVSVEMVKETFLRLKAPNDLSEKVQILCKEHLVQHDLSSKAIRRLIKRVGADLVNDLITLRKADSIGAGLNKDVSIWDDLRARINVELDTTPVVSTNALVINGRDLMDIGVEQGPRMGTILDALLEKVLDDPELNSKKTLLTLATAMQGGSDDNI